MRVCIAASGAGVALRRRVLWQCVDNHLTLAVMAMLEAFVHDPLINWRLLHAMEHHVGVSRGLAVLSRMDATKW